MCLSILTIDILRQSLHIFFLSTNPGACISYRIFLQGKLSYYKFFFGGGRGRGGVHLTSLMGLPRVDEFFFLCTATCVCTCAVSLLFSSCIPSSGHCLTCEYEHRFSWNLVNQRTSTCRLFLSRLWCAGNSSSTSAPQLFWPRMITMAPCKSLWVVSLLGIYLTE